MVLFVRLRTTDAGMALHTHLRIILWHKLSSAEGTCQAISAEDSVKHHVLHLLYQMAFKAFTLR